MIKKIPFPLHKVKKGETLRSISKEYGIDCTKILLNNKISPRQIKEGVFLVLKK